MALTREQIQAVDDIKRVEISPPGWSGTVWVQTLTALDRDKLEQWTADRRRPDGTTDHVGVRAFLAVLVTVDENGQKLFQEGDEQWLSGKGAPAVQAIYEAALATAHISKADVEELAKNSEGGPAEGSPSA